MYKSAVLNEPEFLPGVKGESEYDAWKYLNKLMELNMVIISARYCEGYKYWLDHDQIQLEKVLPAAIIDTYITNPEVLSILEVHKLLSSSLQNNLSGDHVRLLNSGMQFCYEKAVKEINLKTDGEYAGNIPKICPWTVIAALSYAVLTE